MNDLVQSMYQRYEQSLTTTTESPETIEQLKSEIFQLKRKVEESERALVRIELEHQAAILRISEGLLKLVARHIPDDDDTN